MRYALLVGIDDYPQAPLRGCVNDAYNVGGHLISYLGWRATELRYLLDSKATKQAIVSEIKSFAKKAQPGDTVILWFSGHGTQLPALNKQGEIDGLDEVYCCHGFDWDKADATGLRDDEFARLVHRFRKGVQLFVGFDCCHSGDMERNLVVPRTFPLSPEYADLLFILRERFYADAVDWFSFLPRWLDWLLWLFGLYRTRPQKPHSGPASVPISLVSACREDQTAADAYLDGNYQGAFTHFVLKAHKRHSLGDNTYRVLETTKRLLAEKGFDQIPQVVGPLSVGPVPFLGGKVD